MHILVTGGAGYVGSNVVHALLEAGHRVSVIDDLSSGHRAALPENVPLQEGRCGDREALDRLAAETPVDGVMHMAAKCSVGESMRHPRSYYAANVRDSLDLLDWAVDRGVGWMIHSSTCAVYGEPDEQPIAEDTCERPVNAYGATKLAVDNALAYYAGAYELRRICFRYFNAAGAGYGGSLGEDKTPASNLVPRVLAVASGREESVAVFGDEYDTPDGTGIRDYVHVTDLAAAHLAGMESLAAGEDGGVFNLGTESGSSVLDVIRCARKVTGHPIPARTGPPRPGDPPELVAASAKARERLGWNPSHGLQSILEDAWRWHSRHPDGYEGSGEQGR